MEKKYQKGRSPFYYKIDNDVVTVYLCNPDTMGAEAEYIMSLDKSYLPAFIATLKGIQGE